MYVYRMPYPNELMHHGIIALIRKLQKLKQNLKRLAN